MIGSQIFIKITSFLFIRLFVVNKFKTKEQIYAILNFCMMFSIRDTLFVFLIFLQRNSISYLSTPKVLFFLFYWFVTNDFFN